MDTNPIILIVGATRKESIHIEKCLIDWKYEAVPLEEEVSGIAAPIPKSPILLVVGRYKMSQFYELRRHMGNVPSIVTPFNQEEIQTRIDEIIDTT